MLIILTKNLVISISMFYADKVISIFFNATSITQIFFTIGNDAAILSLRYF